MMVTATTTQRYTRSARNHHVNNKPLTGTIATAFVVVLGFAISYITYVLWPWWTKAPVLNDPPSLPIVIAGVTFNIEPGAIRHPIQRQVGTQERLDLAYLWPSLLPAGTNLGTSNISSIDPMAWLFVTIESGDNDLPLMQRVQSIYRRYLAAAPTAGPPGLTLRGFRDDSPYKGEELAFESQTPEHFLARCSHTGADNSDNCLLERRIGDATVTIRFPRTWLADWKNVGSGVERLMARLHPAP
jgi:hypothetical protein